MIQELLGGGGVGVGVGVGVGSNLLGSYGRGGHGGGGGGDRKISISNILENPSPSSSLANHNHSTTNQSTTTSAPENLRCPRCDSPNTKFCYYNNYNLTQPRHFCKTCRRYWTKGGALRNVPIGGGCRKNKSSSTANILSASAAAAAGGKTVSSGNKLIKTILSSSENGNHEISSNPMWGPPQTSQLLALLRSTQNPNPNPNLSHISNSCLVKDEGIMMGSASNLGLDQAAAGRTLGLDPSFCRNNQFNGQQEQQQQQDGFILGEVQSNGTSDLYQRFRSFSTNYYPDQAPLILGNVTNSSSIHSSAILDSAPVAAGAELGYWNPSLVWASDLQTTTGAYH